MKGREECAGRVQRAIGVHTMSLPIIVTHPSPLLHKGLHQFLKVTLSASACRYHADR